MTKIRLGISTCPNDTYAFHGLLTGAVRAAGVDLEIELADVQELNEGFAAGRYDIAKGSFFAAAARSDEIVVLNHGAALGFGVGPVMLSRPGWPENGDIAAARVLVPGRDTTAHLLLRTFHPEISAPRFVVFSEIMPALAAGQADLGVCIHEGRFSYAASDLGLMEDLGARWEIKTGLALPLGGIFARSNLDPSIVQAVDLAIRDSLALADERPEATLATMKAHAQELSDEFLWEHVRLYVGDATRGLGAGDKKAILSLQAVAKAAELIPRENRDLCFSDA